MKKIFLTLLIASWFSMLGQGKGMQGVFTTENDFLAPANEDENYTGSAKIELLFPACFKVKPLMLNDKDAINIHRFGFGGIAYTPYDLTLTAPDTGDRPYASLMFINLGTTSYGRNTGRILQTDLIVGLMGTSLPGNAQAYIHENWTSITERPIPLGWDNQVGYSNSWIANFNARMELPIGKEIGKFGELSWLQFKWTPRVEIGNYMINVQSGVKANFLNFRTGVMQDYIAALPTSGVAPVGPPPAVPRKFRCNGFFEPQIKVIGYNATLEGRMFNDHSVYTIDHDEIRRLLFDFNGGVNMVFCDWLYLKYTLYGRSQEFKNGKSFHMWGGISLGFSGKKWNR